MFRHNGHFVAILLWWVSEVKSFNPGSEAPSIGTTQVYFRHGDIDIQAINTQVMPRVLAQLFISRSPDGAPALYQSELITQVKLGNEQRDVSQAISPRTLRFLPEPVLRKIVEHVIERDKEFGDITLTKQELGAYASWEHVDNPADFKSGKILDDKRLRTSVTDAEVEVDTNTAMKNYIANEGQGYKTSAQYVRDTLTQSITILRKIEALPENDRVSEQNIDQAKFALRLLGAALHTFQDFFAHSNYIETLLIELGVKSSFPHVGERTMVEVSIPHGPQKKLIYPIVTGTSGSTDFIHSIITGISDIMIAKGEESFKENERKNKNWFGTFIQEARDTLTENISEQILKLGNQLIDAERENQFEVFVNATSTNPTHSMLAKDHFTSVYNYPAGIGAVAISKYVIGMHTKAVDDRNTDLKGYLDAIIGAAFHHPALVHTEKPGLDGRKAVFDAIANWWKGLSADAQEMLIIQTNKNGVKTHQHNQAMLAERKFSYERVQRAERKLPAEPHMAAKWSQTSFASVTTGPAKITLQKRGYSSRHR